MPQFIGSVAMLVQVEPQQMSPAGHVPQPTQRLATQR
jgi:hypothetical protein